MQNWARSIISGFGAMLDGLLAFHYAQHRTPSTFPGLTVVRWMKVSGTGSSTMTHGDVNTSEWRFKFALG
jgi:hypothetical protein